MCLNEKIRGLMPQCTEKGGTMTRKSLGPKISTPTKVVGGFLNFSLFAAYHGVQDHQMDS